MITTSTRVNTCNWYELKLIKTYQRHDVSVLDYVYLLLMLLKLLNVAVKCQTKTSNVPSRTEAVCKSEDSAERRTSWQGGASLKIYIQVWQQKQVAFKSKDLCSISIILQYWNVELGCYVFQHYWNTELQINSCFSILKLIEVVKHNLICISLFWVAPRWFVSWNILN